MDQKNKARLSLTYVSISLTFIFFLRHSEHLNWSRISGLCLMLSAMDATSSRCRNGEEVLTRLTRRQFRLNISFRSCSLEAKRKLCDSITQTSENQQKAITLIWTYSQMGPEFYRLLHALQHVNYEGTSCKTAWCRYGRMFDSLPEIDLFCTT